MRTRWVALAATAVLDAAVVATVVPVFGAMAAANAFMAVLGVTAGVFVGLYGWRSNWRQTSGGRAVMALMACIATICLIGTAGAYFGDYSGRPIVRLVAFVAVQVTMMNLLLTLIAAQAKRDEEGES